MHLLKESLYILFIMSSYLYVLTFKKNLFSIWSADIDATSGDTSNAYSKNTGSYMCISAPSTITREVGVNRYSATKFASSSFSGLCSVWPRIICPNS